MTKKQLLKILRTPIVVPKKSMPGEVDSDRQALLEEITKKLEVLIEALRSVVAKLEKENGHG